jgi:hypothetical protein
VTYLVSIVIVMLHLLSAKEPTRGYPPVQQSSLISIKKAGKVYIIDPSSAQAFHHHISNISPFKCRDQRSAGDNFFNPSSVSHLQHAGQSCWTAIGQNFHTSSKRLLLFPNHYFW